MIRRTSKYSSGQLYTEYLKVCIYCNKEFWAGRKRTVFCSRTCCGNSLRKIHEPLESFFREKITRLKGSAKQRKINFDLKW